MGNRQESASDEAFRHLTGGSPRFLVTGAKPFLKWVGSKRQLVPELLKRVPPKFGTYYEPFVGGGALFFALQPPMAGLADNNLDLVKTYWAVRDNVEELIHLLREYADMHSEKFYYDMRGNNTANLEVDVAARFIYLNKTCFNGLYRVNKGGGFNVPMGRYTNPTICDDDGLRACSEVMKAGTVQIVRRDFRASAMEAQAGDFVYFDSPYVPLSATSNFASYTKDGFGAAEQVALRDLALDLKRRGVHVLLSNSTAARDLYAKGFTVEEVQCRRSVNSKAAGRGAITELLIS